MATNAILGEYLEEWEGAIDISLPRLLETRLLLQANSGGGKSWALRRILEQTADQVQQIVIDMEGEFASLRERFDYIVCAPHDGDAIAHPGTAKLLSRKLLETGVSAIIDIYDLKAHERKSFVQIFCESLVNAPKRLWHPAIVVLDEAHVFAPEKGRAESTGAVIDLATRGRKRGFCLIAATQRLAKLNKDVAAELINKLIGRTGQDIDVRRAADELGMTLKEAMPKLRTLKPGEFYCFGPALHEYPIKISVGPVKTSHPKAGQRLMKAPPAPSQKILKVLATLGDLPKEAAQEAQTLEDMRGQLSSLRRELTVAKKTGGGISEIDVQQRIRREVARVTAEANEETRLLRNESAELRKANKAQADRLSRIGKLVVVPIDVPKPPAVVPRERSMPRGVVSLPVASIREHEESEPVSFEGVSRSQQKILNALAGLEVFGMESPPRAMVAAHSRFSPGAGHFTNLVGGLRTAGLIDYPQNGLIGLTSEGRKAAKYPAGEVTKEDIQKSWLKIMPTRSHAILLETLIENYPEPMSRDELAQITNFSTGTGHFTNLVGKLRTLGAAEYPRQGYIKATSFVCPEG